MLKVMWFIFIPLSMQGCLIVAIYLCLQEFPKITKLNFMKFGTEVAHEQKENPLHSNTEPK